MTLGEHLGEFCTRIIRIALAVALGGVLGWSLSDPVVAVLMQPY